MPVLSLISSFTSTNSIRRTTARFASFSLSITTRQPGDTGLPASAGPAAADKGFGGPAMNYHLRTGGHGLTAADWNVYLNGGLFAR